MILVIADTPVAGTVERISAWLEKISGIKTVSLIKRNYAHHAFPVENGCFGAVPNWQEYLGKLASKASLIIFHNVLDQGVLNIIYHKKKPSTPAIYQIHSPPLEGPQFTYSILAKYKFDVIFSVNQGHGRFIKDTVPVPNIIPDFSNPLGIRKENHLFLPHIRSTEFRWSNKFSAEDKKSLEMAKNLFNGLEITSVEKLFSRAIVSHQEVKLMLLLSKFAIDDINSGLMHQTALEGLKAGCGVFSSADLFTIDEYSKSINAPPPPTIPVRDVRGVIKYLANHENIEAFDENNILEYSKTYLGEERLANIYFKNIEKFVS